MTQTPPSGPIPLVTTPPMSSGSMRTSPCWPAVVGACQPSITATAIAVAIEEKKCVLDMTDSFLVRQFPEFLDEADNRGNWHEAPVTCLDRAALANWSAPESSAPPHTDTPSREIDRCSRSRRSCSDWTAD